jgi:hypothetical protein
MKRLVLGLVLVFLLGIIAVSYADEPGSGGPGEGCCPYCGQPMGRGMMGGGMMGHGMMGYDSSQSEECQKFLDENAGIRKELNNKRFEYQEAMRNPKTTSETIGKLAKELHELYQKIRGKAPRGCRY